ncbi:MAG: hypothetical protein AAFY56_01515 [Pseudomonadota bacterium]
MRTRFILGSVFLTAFAGIAVAVDGTVEKPTPGEPMDPLALEAANILINAEAVIPPQCYTRSFGEFNPCYTCHQNYTDYDRPNRMSDGGLQAAYEFSDYGFTNRWHNLFVDRSQAIAATPDAAILDWINTENYTDLGPRLEEMGWRGWMPDLENLHLAAAAFDEDGFARDGSGWVAFNYKPLPSTFWPTNGSTDDVMIRLPEAFRSTSEGQPSRDAYLANLSLVEMAFKDLEVISTPPIDETVVGVDLNDDGELSVVEMIDARDTYVGAASDIEVARMLYPEGTQFLHSVRYIGVAEDGAIIVPPRMKELRYMEKIRFLDQPRLRSIYDNEHQEKKDELLPRAVNQGDRGLDAGFGWLVQGFIEDREGHLRQQTYEETLFCMGCHGTVGATLDQTFAFPRKVTGAEGWGYINLRGMQDSPNVGEEIGEILTYLERVGGGGEFRENDEMAARWFDEDGAVDRAKVLAAPDVYSLITPSPERALALNKAYKQIVDEQSYIFGRDAVLAPAHNVFDVVDPETAPTLDEKHQFSWDLRLDWTE